MSRQRFARKHRGAILVLTAFLLIALTGMLAFAIDLGYIVLVRTQLQAAADASALSAATRLSVTTNVFPTAQEFANHNTAHGKPIDLQQEDVEIGHWNAATRQFTPGQGGNAVRVTTRSQEGAPLFFGRVFGKTSFQTQASAVAVCNPRDIAFVVDLSGSMNDDSEPCWGTAAINSTFGSQGFPNIGNSLVQDLYTDLGFGSFPGTLHWIGQGMVSSNASAYANLTANGGPLTQSSVPATYRIVTSDSEANRKLKAYRWIMDNQLASLMPNAKPTPSSSNYAFWEKYLDYVIAPQSASGRGTLPPNQDSRRISSFNNPNRDTFPNAGNANGWRNQIGYRTYVQWLMDNGRDIQPDGVTYMQHSQHSPHRTYRSENTAGGVFSFPAREQPTHAARRALIAALQVIKERNLNLSDPNQQDQVSIITFDRRNPGPMVVQPLTSNFQVAMQACTELQAVGDIGASTTTEAGLEVARQHLAPRSQGGSGRENVNRIVVLLTDGVPNDYVSSNSAINGYRSSNPSDDYYTSGRTAYNAALMQTHQMQSQNWGMYPVGLGLGTDYDFMDRLARMGGTADDDGMSTRGSGNPAQYEQRLADIFKQIIENPRVRLVQ